MEPVKGFLGRYLRRKLLEHELRECAGTRNAEMAAVVEWLPRVWLHLNKFLETHSSSDVTIGNRLEIFEVHSYLTIRMYNSKPATSILISNLWILVILRLIQMKS